MSVPMKFGEGRCYGWLYPWQSPTERWWSKNSRMEKGNLERHPYMSSEINILPFW